MRPIAVALLLLFCSALCAGCGGRDAGTVPARQTAPPNLHGNSACAPIDSILLLADPRPTVARLRLRDDSCGLRTIDTLLARNRYDLLDLLRLNAATGERLGVGVFGRLRACNTALFTYFEHAPDSSQVVKLATWELRLAVPDSIRTVRWSDLTVLFPDSCVRRHRKVVESLVEGANRVDQ